MTKIILKCDNCEIEFLKEKKEYNRRIRSGNKKFYCCQSCASIDTKTTHESIVRKCAWCQKDFDSTTHKNHKKCCSKLCANRISHSFVDNKKLSKTMREKFIRGEIKIPSREGLVSVDEVKPKVCPFCKTEFRAKTKYCSRECVREMRRAHLPEYEKYKRECRFQFGIKNYPQEFDFSLIEKYGWYKPKNHGNNLGGVSRDHIMSVKWGFENKIDPKYIRHPANCQLLIHSDNISKGKKQSITLDILLERIRVWDSKYSFGRVA
jgi:hypothetical protein